MRNKDFVVFILSHGRADRVYTIKTLEKYKYTGDWYIICDNEDETLEDYYRYFGKDKVIVFDKLAKSKECDTLDNLDARNIVLFARNSCHEIAKKLGYRYFLELDDDYKSFLFRYPEGDKLGSAHPKSLDDIFDAVLDFYKDLPSIKTITFAQGGDFIGGLDGGKYKQGILRKAMNTFFCDVQNPFTFIGRINEDVNTYCLYGSQGNLFLTITDVMINQVDTQANLGGLTDSYLSLGTYIKSFYTVMCCPSSVKISAMITNHQRIHHIIDWDRTVPKIISDRFKIK